MNGKNSGGVAVAITLERNGWCWAMEYNGEKTESKFAFGTLELAAQDAERIYGSLRWRDRRKKDSWKRRERNCPEELGGPRNPLAGG